MPADAPVPRVSPRVVERLEEMFWSDARRAHSEAGALLAALGDQPSTSESIRLEILVAATRIRLGETDETAVRLSGALRWATEHADPFVAVRSHRLLSSLFDRLDDATLALEHAVAAHDKLSEEDTVLTRAAVLLSVADALGSNGSAEKSRPWYAASAALVAETDLIDLQLLIVNNQAFTEYLHGDMDQAARMADDLIRRSADAGRSLRHFDRDTIAGIWMDTGRWDDAAEMLAPYDDWNTTDTTRPEAVAMCLLGLSRLRRRQNDPVAAQRAVDWARRMCEKHQLASSGVQVAREQAEIHALGGEFEKAYESHKDFHQRYLAHRAAMNDAHARTLQVMFDTTQAIKDSEHFRDLAERDPLTGLRNRRFVDERLPGLLASATATAPLTVALIDLDRFKQINDTCSHEAGDEVLRIIAQALARSAETTDGGIAARMGGEEFLLALPGLAGAAAAAALERLRADIAAHDWSAVVGTLPVTASIGSATAPDDATGKRELLSVADARLYRAKSMGRNRVVDGHEPFTGFAAAG